MKALKKLKKIVYIIANKSGLRLVIKNIMKIRFKASKKGSDYSNDNSDSNSLLAIDSI